MNRACELSRPHTSTRLCNSSHCVSMLCFETVSVCIVTMLTNCDPFNRRPAKNVFGSHAVNDCRVSRSSRFTLTLPHLCLHTLTPHIRSCYDRVFVYIVYCRGKSCIGPHFLFLEGSSLENANSFALLFFLFSPFSAHDTKCLIWTRLKMLQGIVRILFSVSH